MTDVALVRRLVNLDAFPDPLRGCAVTIGNFDGVHLGHARIVERLVAAARRVGGPAVVFTFDPHPARVLRPELAPPPLCWTERKAQLLAELGADVLVAHPPSRGFLELEPGQFFDQVLRSRLDALAVVEGPNFRFGRHRLGDIEVLKSLCAERGTALEVVEPLRVEGEIVSSSWIRALLSEGRVDRAGQMLTQPYRIRGRVVRGAGRGNQLGYPTANLEGVDCLLPPNGIYAGRGLVEDRLWPAAISLGPNPTFDEGAAKVEVHLLDYAGELYGHEIEVDFLARLRDIVRFDSVDRLLAQMRRDLDAARSVAAGRDLSNQP